MAQMCREQGRVVSNDRLESLLAQSAVLRHAFAEPATVDSVVDCNLWQMKELPTSLGRREPEIPVLPSDQRLLVAATIQPHLPADYGVGVDAVARDEVLCAHLGL